LTVLPFNNFTFVNIINTIVFGLFYKEKIKINQLIMWLSVFVILITSISIYYSGEYFASASSKVGDYLGLSKSAKGATLDAISSSMPELMISLFSLIVFHEFSVGIGTIVGSALFNILIIPAVCVFLAPVVFKVSDEVVHRDGLFYNLTIIILLTAIFFSKEWSVSVAIIFLGTYFLYIFEIFRHGSTQNYVTNLLEFFKHGPKLPKKRVKKRKTKVRFEIGIMLFTLLIIAVSSYFLVEHAISLSHFLGIPPIIISFTVIAAATSFPDLVVSATNAKKGDISDASSNVFGSNIFDILVGLGLPIFIARLIKIPVIISVESMTIVFGLLASTVLVLYIFAEKMILTKPKAVLMLLIYLGLVAYTIFLV